MKVFISWSGAVSLKFATALRDWLKCVLQNTEPFLSSEDIRKGSVWFSTIRGELETTGAGIICLTKDTMAEPWILFEAGAIARGMSQDRVCTLLLNFEPAILRPPLSQFNATRPTAEDMRKLLKSINDGLGPKGLTEKLLDTTFERFWPDLEGAIFQAQLEAPETKKADYKPEDILPEVLELCRSMHRNQQYELEQWRAKTGMYPADLADALAVGASNFGEKRQKTPDAVFKMMLENRRKREELEAALEAEEKAKMQAQIDAAIKAGVKHALEEEAELEAKAKKQSKSK